MKRLFYLSGLLMVFMCSCSRNPKESIETVSDTVLIKEYYSSGKVKSEISAIGELRQGWTRNYDLAGRLISEVYYIDNVREGTARNFYAATGKLNSTIEFKNGIKQGNEIWYYESGKPYRISPFVNGMIEGIQTLYFENGQVMAEVPYKGGLPGVGLKEYKQDGTLIRDYPRLIIRKEDHLKDANKVLLFISLSEETSGVKFYKGPLLEGKYLHKNLLLMATQNGISQIDYNIPPGAAVNQKVIISANFKTRYGNPLIISKSYNLQVINN
jgi:antitoxin component YwqK of YwqJK toxin-antitoxin module